MNRVAQVERLHSLGRFAEARALAQDQLRQSPDDSYVLFLLGRTLHMLGERSQALEVVERGLVSGTATCELLTLRAAINQRRKPNAALEDLAAALQLQPNNRAAHIVRIRSLPTHPGLLVGHRRKQLLTLADRSLEALMLTGPNESSTHVMAAQVHMMRREFQGAIGASQRALHIDPSNPEAHELLGDALDRVGRRSEAGDAYVAAGRLDPVTTVGGDRLNHLGRGTFQGWGLGFLSWLLFYVILRSGQLRAQEAGIPGVVIALVMLLSIVGFLHLRRFCKRRSAAERLSTEARTAFEVQRSLR